MKKLVVCLLVVILLSACQPGAASQPAAATPLAPVQASSPVETLANSVDELLGVWWFPTMGMVEFKTDGSSRVFRGDETFAQMNYTFDNGKVSWSASSSCENKPATYEAYVTKQDNKRISLHMKVVGNDACADRVITFGSIGKFQNP